MNSTDKRFFWLANYAQPALWVGLAILAMVRLDFKWLTLVGEYTYIPWHWEKWGGQGADMRAVIALVLTITNTLAFSRCDKFSQASGLVEQGLHSGSLARNVGGALVSRLFNRGG